MKASIIIVRNLYDNGYSKGIPRAVTMSLSMHIKADFRPTKTLPKKQLLDIYRLEYLVKSVPMVIPLSSTF